MDSSVLGPMSKSKEPVIMQVFVFPETNMTPQVFKRKLYVLRKRTTHKIGLQKSFYICTLNTQTIVYKGQLTPSQVIISQFYFMIYCRNFAEISRRCTIIFRTYNKKTLRVISHWSTLDSPRTLSLRGTGPSPCVGWPIMAKSIRSAVI